MAYYGKKGRPGQRGGSLPKSGMATHAPKVSSYQKALAAKAASKAKRYGPKKRRSIAQDRGYAMAAETRAATRSRDAWMRSHFGKRGH